MHYIDGFVLPVPKNNIERYREMASIAGSIWKKHGALSYVEAVIEDAGQQEFGLPFPSAYQIEPDEITVFSYIVYESRQHRDAVNKKVMDDPAMKEMGDTYGDVFDCRRMVYSGFKAIVEL